MIKAIMNGINGHMGKVIEGLISEDDGIELVAGIDVADDGSHKVPVFTNIKECDAEADVVIDFSHVSAMEGLFSFCEEKGLPVVLCTTGLSEEQLAQAEELSGKVPVLRSANMSLGVNTLLNLVAEAAKVFSKAGFDIEVLEKHHNQKVDAPSGTALALADAMNDALPEKYDYVYDRSARREKRPKKEIGISAIRGGNIVGEHQVIFAGTDEVITFEHQATSKAVFAKGAIEAAKYLPGKDARMYTMADVIKG